MLEDEIARLPELKIIGLSLVEFAMAISKGVVFMSKMGTEGLKIVQPMAGIEPRLKSPSQRGNYPNILGREYFFGPAYKLRNQNTRRCSVGAGSTISAEWAIVLWPNDGGRRDRVYTVSDCLCVPHQRADRDVFVYVRPVNSYSFPDQPPVASLRVGRVSQFGEPGQRSGNLATVGQYEVHRVIGEANVHGVWIELNR